MTWPARVKKLEGRVKDVEEITFDDHLKIGAQGRRLDAVERKTGATAERLHRLAAAVKRLRARVLARSRQRRKRKR